ncbi:hypothetical protein [Bacillus cereus]|uniref:hypothetical protein n=1 Tax=Bacillus cereus TaxID=1396 RepID=UPI00032EF760|nr:hypothetical protein [Bacillus cereus]EOO44492.1 hypothetical protein ICK_06267 [Bacillus cereus BAG1X2-2]
MELIKVYLDLNSKAENNLFSSMHMSSALNDNSVGINTWRALRQSSSAPPYVIGSTMPVGFSRSTERNNREQSIADLLESAENRTPSSTIPGLGTRYVDQKIDETKEEYKVRKKKESIKFNVKIGIGICFLTLAVLTKLAVTIFSALW